MKTLVNDTQKKTILSIVTGLALAIASPAFALGVEVQAVAKKPAVKAAPAKPATADDRDLSQVAPPETPEAAAQPAQAAAEEAMAKNPAPTLLFGVTGSGKTEIYAKLIADAVAAGNQALLSRGVRLSGSIVAATGQDEGERQGEVAR